MAAGGETRLGATTSDWRVWEGGETGDNRPVTILTPRRRQRSGGAANGRGAAAMATAARAS
jgi:hypothetical protein